MDVLNSGVTVVLDFPLILQKTGSGYAVWLTLLEFPTVSTTSNWMMRLVGLGYISAMAAPSMNLQQLTLSSI